MIGVISYVEQSEPSSKKADKSRPREAKGRAWSWERERLQSIDFELKECRYARRGIS